MSKNLILAAASAAAFLSLSACDKKSHTITSGVDDPQAAELAKAPPVELPPAIGSSKTYRCKDNSLVYVSFLTDNMTVLIRDKQESPPLATLKAPTAGAAFVGDGYTVSGNGPTITYTTPTNGAQSCKS